MQKALLILLLFWIGPVFAISCDCEVRAHAPLTESHKLPPVILKTYELEEFSAFSKTNSRKRVKAKLGKKGLGNCTNFIQVLHLNLSCS